MTFRPSVLPDRDNDILSTFTRSFERGRTLARQDALDRRARTEFEQRQEDRTDAREMEELRFNLEAARTPGFDVVRGDPNQIEMAQALGGRNPRIPGIELPAAGGRDVAATDIEGGGMIPAIPGRAISQRFPDQEVQIPEDVLPRGLRDRFRPDSEILGTGPGGGTAVFSRQLAQEGAADERARLGREEGALEEELGGPERRRLAAARVSEQNTIRFLVEAGMLTRADGTTILPAELPEDFDPAAIENIMGRRLSSRAATDVGDTGLTPAQEEARRRAALAAERAFQDDVRAQVQRRITAEARAVAARNENALGKFDEDFEPEVVDEAAIQLEVLQAMREVASPEERGFIDARLQRLQTGGVRAPSGGGGAAVAGGGLSEDDLVFWGDVVSDIVDDDEAERVLIEQEELSEEEAAAVIARRGSGG